VALSLGSPPPDVIRHRMSMEPGLSSLATFRSLRERPSGRLTLDEMRVSGGCVKPLRHVAAAKSDYPEQERSDFVEAAACRDEAAGHAQRVDGAVLLDGSDARAIGFDAAVDLDLACRAARLDAERDG
jgi:hypothetical protein